MSDWGRAWSEVDPQVLQLLPVELHQLRSQKWVLFLITVDTTDRSLRDGIAKCLSYRMNVPIRAQRMELKMSFILFPFVRLFNDQ